MSIGVSLIYGSLDEAMAIHAYTRQRNVDFMKGVLSVAGPEQANEFIKKFRGILFPEEAFDDIKYLKKAKDIFEKLRKVDLRAFATDAKEMG